MSDQLRVLVRIIASKLKENKVNGGSMRSGCSMEAVDLVGSRQVRDLAASLQRAAEKCLEIVMAVDYDIGMRWLTERDTDVYQS